MTQTHSPLPWRYEEDHDTGPYDEEFNRFYRVLDASGKEVCRCDTEEQARLYANAVNCHAQLVEACKGLLDSIRERHPEDFRDGGNGYSCPHITRIAAAIAKAEEKQ